MDGKHMEHLWQSSRRRFVKQLGALGGAGLGASLLPAALRAAVSATLGIHSQSDADSWPIRTGPTPLQHVLIACQENRSFDTYYGYASFVDSYGVPPGYTQPNGNGGTVAPYLFTDPIVPNITHSWQAIHSEWDNGLMDGFYTTDGINCMGYYDQSILAYYYSLFGSSTLCGNYFCSSLTDTYPNRLYLMGGTAGGNTSNSIAGASLNYPIILDVLDAYKVSWKMYNVPVAVPLLLGSNNVALFFKKWANDPRIGCSVADYYSDLLLGHLPQVSFIVPAPGFDEHPPADVKVGQSAQQAVVQALQSSSYWSKSAYLLTYDEGGGYFEHVAPPVYDAYGGGVRVPMWVLSPYARKSNMNGTQNEHASTLKFLEYVFSLPTLASVNHQFDERTPGKNNAAAHGKKYGPPAPPRDGLDAIGDLTDCFNF